MPKKKGLGVDCLLGCLEENKKTSRKERNKKRKIKRTFEISEEIDLLLEKVKLSLKAEGKKVTKNELVEEAIRLLAERYGLEKEDKKMEKS